MACCTPSSLRIVHLFSAHRAYLKLCMARSGAGLGPGLVRVIGRTRPWPGLAWGEPHGVPQHSSVDPPNTINHRGARGMQGPPPKSSHTATRRLPPRQSATGPTSLGARLAALGRAQHLEAMRCPCSRRRAHARSADAPRTEGVHVSPRRVARSLHGLHSIKTRRIRPVRGTGQLRQAGIVTKTPSDASARDGLWTLRRRRRLWRGGEST